MVGTVEVPKVNKLPYRVDIDALTDEIRQAISDEVDRRCDAVTQAISDAIRTAQKEPDKSTIIEDKLRGEKYRVYRLKIEEQDFEVINWYRLGEVLKPDYMNIVNIRTKEGFEYRLDIGYLKD